MITELTLQQFKAHTATRIPLGKLTVVVGQNAAGKTSILEGLLLLSRLLDQPPESVFTGKYDLRWVLRRGATEELKIQALGCTETSYWEFLVTAPDTTIEKARVDWTDRTRPMNADQEKALRSVFGDELDKQRFPTPPAGASALRGAVALRLEASRLAEPSYSEDETPRLEEDGYGLATALSTLKLTSTEQFMAMEHMACQVIPRLKRISFKRTKMTQPLPRASKAEKRNGSASETQTVIADELVLDYEDAAGLPAHAASEGTLLVLGILCAIFSPSRPNLLLLDDIDRALHPVAQNELLRGLHSVLASSPDLQIVTTTHSPYLVDALEPDEVVVLARGARGMVVAKPLSAHPKAGLLDVLTTGELWTAEGEGWAGQP